MKAVLISVENEGNPRVPIFALRFSVPLQDVSICGFGRSESGDATIVLTAMRDAITDYLNTLNGITGIEPGLSLNTRKE
jgi:hypothetical protein